jgi:hypothetical protein
LNRRPGVRDTRRMLKKLPKNLLEFQQMFPTEGARNSCLST